MIFTATNGKKQTKRIGFLLIALSSLFLIGCSTEAINTEAISMDKKIDTSLIKVFKDKIIINQNSVHWGRISLTGSMLPALPSNSTMFWITEFDKLNIGDIVMTNKSEDCSVTHRIIAINGEIHTLKGDNNPYPDNCIYKREDIYALVVGVIY